MDIDKNGGAQAEAIQKMLAEAQADVVQAVAIKEEPMNHSLECAAEYRFYLFHLPQLYLLHFGVVTSQ